MPHPQEQELRVLLTEFFGALREPYEETKSQRILIVQEPESEAMIQFTYFEKEPDEDASEEEDDEADDDILFDDSRLAACVGFDWKTWGKREKDIARRLAITLPRKTKGTNPYTGKVITGTTVATREVEGVEDSLEVGLAILKEIMQIPEDRWLWITDEHEYDQWPDPLPKPEVWPPVGPSDDAQAPPLGGRS